MTLDRATTDGLSGIDVQTELQMKSGSPAFPPGFMQQLTGMSQMQSSQPPLQRAAIQRQHARRSGQALTPKLAPGHSHGDLGFNSTSPQAGPTPSSHVSSPSNLSTRSPIAMQTGGMTPPASGVHAQSHGQHTSHFPRSQQSSLNPVRHRIFNEPNDLASSRLVVMVCPSLQTTANRTARTRQGALAVAPTVLPVL
jgi:hypothetical protein